MPLVSLGQSQHGCRADRHGLAGFQTTPTQTQLGGTLYYSVGDSATRYYQPFGRFLVGFHEHVAAYAYAEWRWYAMIQPVFLIQGFRSNQKGFAPIRRFSASGSHVSRRSRTRLWNG